jgi:hypothetical protein
MAKLPEQMALFWMGCKGIFRYPEEIPITVEKPLIMKISSVYPSNAGRAGRCCSALTATR